MRKETSGGGIGFLGLLTLLFIGLKLAGFISWSWWWVTVPVWGIPTLLLVAWLVIVAVALVNRKDK